MREGAALRPASSSPAPPAFFRHRRPPWPGGYDFARDAYFKGIGAVGSILGQVRTAPPPATKPDSVSRLAARVDDGPQRADPAHRGAIGGQAGAVAAPS